MDNILDLKTGQLTVIIGTLFKEQRLKPCVFTNLEGVISSVSSLDCSTGEPSLIGKFTSETDFAILEDVSGRIQIRESEIFKCNQFVTGSIVALLGVADKGGYFVCKDFCFAGIPFKVELPRQIKVTLNRNLFESL
jgi:DNA polymerase delta subunit 2